PWAIDSAFLRPGRFDEKIYIPLPDLTARKKLFELQLKKSPTSKDMDFDYLAKISDGFNGADIKEFCEKLKMSAINDSLEKGVERPIDMSDVEKVEATMKSSVSAEDIERLQEFENN
ncbi:MAG: ATP-binding protein, partial [Bacilli bacterium]|nr:ATP-binding protein [Bacilli bacterium]